VNKLVQQIVLGTFALTAISAAFAADPKPEDEVRYRQSNFNVIGRNFAALGAIAKGERPYDQAFATKSANVVATLSTLPFGSFGPGTDVGTHKADPKVWSDNAKFKEAADKFQFEAAKLPAAAKDLDTLKLQVGAVGKTCKACHDDYRVKDKK
jgi:cytochrome c556